MVKSLKEQILEHLNLKHGDFEGNAKKAIHDFVHSDNKRFKGKSKKARIRMALGAAGAAAHESVNPKVGDDAIYEGKKCVVRSISESGMATIRFGNNRELIVRANKLQSSQLTEGFIGIAPILPTYRADATDYGFVKLEGLSPEDIGLIFEDDDLGEKDDQEEDTDNGSNVRHDGHTLKKEVDELPTPSDTIAPAYSDEKPPKELGEPLSTHPGAQEEHLWDEPNWDGYDYPSDAPIIPTAEFDGADMGNSRAPHFNDDEHQAGDGQEDRDDDESDNDNRDDEDDDDDKERTDESDHWIQGTHVDEPGHKGNLHRALHVPQGQKIGASRINKARHSGNAHIRQMANMAHNMTEGEVKDPARDEGEERKEISKMRKDLEFSESYFVAEMDDMLGPGEDTEPKADDTITVTLPAMAAILCTVANKVGGDHEMLKAIVEALAEVSKGKTVDMDDLDAVAAHINGEELPEVENRDHGHPDHDGMSHESHDHSHEDSEEDSWPGDGDETKSGKTKLMAGESITEGLYYGGYDVLDDTKLTDDEEIAILYRRAFPHGVRSRR